MTRKQIIKGNKLIAIFMVSKDGKKLEVPGMIYQQDTHDDLYIWDKDYLDEEECKSFKYHKSWDWLMPVVYKIHTLEMTPGYILKLADVSLSLSKIDIDDLYLTVVKFIKWYNRQSND
jgi:hypothetical protein